MKNLDKFLEFNGNKISILRSDGTWWVAVKPICEALNVNYNRAYQNLNSDPILSQLFAKQQTVGADNKIREMVCLPERYVYGWLFSLRSDSSDLLEYKRKCYDILYDHFHGTMTGRMEALAEKTEADLRIEELEEALLDSEEYKEIQELKKKKTALNKRLRQLDTDLITGQISMDLN